MKRRRYDDKARGTNGDSASRTEAIAALLAARFLNNQSQYIEFYGLRGLEGTTKGREREAGAPRERKRTKRRFCYWIRKQNEQRNQRRMIHWMDVGTTGKAREEEKFYRGALLH